VLMHAAIRAVWEISHEKRQSKQLDRIRFAFARRAGCYSCADRLWGFRRKRRGDQSLCPHDYAVVFGDGFNE
jgi:hypothetical protein